MILRFGFFFVFYWIAFFSEVKIIEKIEIVDMSRVQVDFSSTELILRSLGRPHVFDRLNTLKMSVNRLT